MIAICRFKFITTEIRFDLKGKLTTAHLGVYNLNGVQKLMAQLDPNQKEFNISGSEIGGAGQYLYSLIIDGQIIDSKKMIVF